MITRRVKVKNPLGLHLRPAKELCRRAMEYESQIMIQFRNKEFNAKSLLGVLSACVQQEDEIVLTFCGKDEEKAAEELTAFAENGMQ